MLKILNFLLPICSRQFSGNIVRLIKTTGLAFAASVCIGSGVSADTLRVDFTMAGPNSEQASGFITYDEAVVAAANGVVSGGGICGGGADNSIDYQISFSGGAADGVVFSKSDCGFKPAFCSTPNFNQDVNFFSCSASGFTGTGVAPNTFAVSGVNYTFTAISAPAPATSTPSPASEFEANEDVIRQVLVDDAQRSLSATLGTNRRMMDKAKDRFAESQRQMAGEGSVIASRNNVAFDVDGSLNLTDAVLSTKGSFFEQNGTFDGSYRRLLFGDLDLQRNNETGSTTLTLSARLAWEHMLSQQTMLGYFIGGELGRSQLSGTFDGDQDRVAVSAGVYGVQQLADNVVLDGFLTLGAGRNNLEMTNGVLDLESDYVTRTATAGASISGAYEFDQYEFRPSFSLNVGRTLIGDVDFTGAAYGLVDDTLSLDAGSVTIANIVLRPEMVWALDGDRVSDSNTQVSFAPRLVCERVIAINRTQNCGSGAELGLTSRSRTGMSNAEVKLVADRIGDATRSSLVFSLEHQF